MEKGSYIMKRENFGSRLGFLLVSAGCAIGIGNVWRFPYVAGQNGGGVFVLFYLLFLLCMGVPVLKTPDHGSRKGSRTISRMSEDSSLRLVVRDERVLSVLTRHLKSREAGGMYTDGSV